MKQCCLVLCVVLILGLASQTAFAGGAGEAKPAKAELEVVAVFYGHANEGTWDPSAFAGLEKAKAKVPFTLSLSEGTTTQDAEKVIRNWASRGVDLIFAHSDIYLDQVVTVAKQFPKVHFVCEMQLDPALKTADPETGKYAPDKTPANLVLAGDTPWEGNFLAGYTAALMSRNNKIGILQPFEAPPLNRYSNCFYFGARAAKPDIEVKVIYIGDYIAPAETRDAVNSLAQQGCDVVFTEMDDNSAILEAVARGIYVIPMYMDKVDVNPGAVLTSVVMDWSGPLTGAIEAVAKGSFPAYRKQWYFRPLSAKEGSIYLGKWGTAVPDSVKQAVADMEKKLKSGAVKVELVNEVIIK
jgi:basic membrane protein A